MSAADGKATGESWLDKLPKDIFGSDVFVSYQGTYVWQANQVGHFAIGFAASSVISWLFAGFGGAESGWYYIVVAVVLLIYGGKEYIDLLIARHQAKDFYEYDKRELWADMAADTWFVISGALVGAGAHTNPWLGIAMAVLFLATFFLLGSWFLPGKVSLDRSGLPYIFRLANFPRTEGVHQHNIDRIAAFIKGREVGGFQPPPAILIQGYRGTGKTTLGVGIGSEIAVSKKGSVKTRGRALYFTAFGLFERGVRKKAEGAPETIRRRKPGLLGTDDPWSAEEAEVLIIDDVDSDSGLYGGSDPKMIVKHLMEQKETFDLLRSKRTVWVTGTSAFDDADSPGHWSCWLEALATLYGREIKDTGDATDPAAVEGREPIPVLWLTQPIVAA